MNRRSFFSLAAGAAAIAAAFRVKSAEAERVMVTGNGLPAGTTMLKADADKLFGVTDPTHTHAFIYADDGEWPASIIDGRMSSANLYSVTR